MADNATLQADLVAALSAQNADGTPKYDDDVAQDAMTLLLLCAGEALPLDPPSDATALLLGRLFDKADLPAGASPDVVQKGVERYFAQHPLPDDLNQMLQQALRAALGGGSAADAAGQRLAQFAADAPRSFEALQQKERPQGTFGGGVLAQLSVMTGENEGQE